VTPVPPAQRLGHTIHRLGAIASTQAEAARLASAGVPEGVVVTATHQTQGRGRRGRGWLDCPGQNLLMSVVLHPRITPGAAPRLSLVAAVAVVDALREVAAVPAAIRWPNDVLVDGRKVAGILPEASTDSAGALLRVILGIGINVNETAFPDEVRETATSLRLASGAAFEVEAVLDSVLAALDLRYGQFLAGGLEAIREAWLARTWTIGRRARGAGGVEGVAIDLAPDGALVLRTDAGETVRVLAGEVTTEADHAPAH